MTHDCFTFRIVPLLLAIGGFAIISFACSAGEELYPPGGKRIINATNSDTQSGNDAYRQVIGQRFRVLVPAIAVCEALKVTRALSPVEVAPRSWLDRFVTVRDIEHLRIQHRAGKSEYFTDYVHCILERDSGEQSHWFTMLASSQGGLPKELPRSPVLDSFQAIFAPEIPLGTAGEIPGSFAFIGVAGPSGAPLLETVQGEERAAPERLIALLQDSPAKGIEETSLYLKQYRFHEVAQAVVSAIEKLPPDERGVSHPRQTAARVLGGIGDPSAVEILIHMLQDQNPSVRTAAAKALADIGSWQALSALENLLLSVQKPGAEPAPSPGGSVVDLYQFRQQRWETSLDVLAAMVAISTQRGPRPAFDDEKSILAAMKRESPSPDDLLNAAALCYQKSNEPMLEGEKTVWLRASVDSMGELIRKYPDDTSVPALRRVLFYISQVRGIGVTGL